MEYVTSDVGPCRKKIVMTFSPEDIDAAFDQSYQEINGYVQLKGFRKGKAPRRALEKRFAKEASSGVRQQLAEQHVREVVEKEKLQVLGGVADNAPQQSPTPGQPFTLEVQLDVAPDFELPEYKGLEIVQEPVPVTDEAVDGALDHYRKMFANYQPVEEAAAVGDVLQVDFQAKIDDEVVMSMQDQRLRVEGETLFGLPCPDLQEKFTGAKAGDVVTLTITMPDDHPNPALRGRPAQIEVAVKAVERGELPPLDDAFASGLGMGSLEEFRNRIRGNLVREALVAAKQKEEDEIIDHLLAAVDYEVPADMVNGETNALVEQRRMRLVRAGVQDDANLRAQLEQYRPEAEKQARRKVRWGIMASKIADKEGITVTNDDLAAQVEALAQSYNTTPAKIIQRIREFDGVAPMMAEILSIKVIQFITRNRQGADANPAADTASAEAADPAAAASEGDGCDCGHDHSSDQPHDHSH